MYIDDKSFLLKVLFYNLIKFLIIILRCFKLSFICFIEDFNLIKLLNS